MVAAGRSLAQACLSPDGLWIAFVAGSGGSTIVVVSLGDGPVPTPGPEVVVTYDPPAAGCHPSGGGVYGWHPDSASLVYSAKDGGIYAVPRNGGVGRQVVRAPAARHCWAPVVSRDGAWVAFVLESDDAQEIAIAPMDGSAGLDPIVVASGPTAEFRIDPTWGERRLGDGTSEAVLAWHEWEAPDMPWDSSRISACSVRGKSVGALTIGTPSSWCGGHGVSVAQPTFAADGRIAHVGDESGWKIVRLDHPTWRGSDALVVEEHEHADPTWGLGQRSYCWSPTSKEIAFCRNEAGFGRLCVVATAGDVGVRELGRGAHLGPSWSVTAAGHSRISVIRSGGRTPTQVVVYDAQTGGRTVVARGPVGGWEALDTPEPVLLEWPSDDGTALHARLYRPVGVDRPPLIVHVHGGPTSQTQVTFNPRFAYWLSHGWAVLVADHRGSTGWGRAYQQAMNERWGELDVSDCASAVRHVVDNSWCDPQRIVAIGGSAGGFTVLHLLAAYPELFAAGVDLFGVTDLVDLDQTTHRYERHYNTTLIGPRPEADAAYRDRSPVNFADQIHTPLLVLHGDADDSVVLGQSLALVDRLRAAGRAVELAVYEGEGHGWRKPDTVVDELRRIDSFLARHAPART